MNNEKKFIKLTPFKMQVLQSFPFIDEDFDAITNYELLCKVVEYLTKTIDNVNLLESDFKVLYDYVHDYFDNLDVQEEINNKLDEMALSGELQTIIESYIRTNAVICFNTIDDLKQNTTLVNGSYAKVLGYDEINDGGKNTYKIRTREQNEKTDDINIILLNNGLVAELIKENDYIPLEKQSYKTFTGVSGNHATVWYAIISKDYKPELTLANNQLDSRQYAYDNALDNLSTITINAGLGSVSTGITRGIVIKDGETLRDNINPMEDSEIIYMLADGTLKSVLATATTQDIEALNPVWAVNGWYPIIKDGVDLTADRDPLDFSQRSFIGQNENGDYIVGCCNGRDYYNTGMSLRDIIAFCNEVEFVPYFLYNLDGGQSSQLVVKGRQVNELQHYNEERQVFNFITFKSKFARNKSLWEKAIVENKMWKEDEAENNIGTNILPLLKSVNENVTIVQTGSMAKKYGRLSVINIVIRTSSNLSTYARLIEGFPPSAYGRTAHYFELINNTTGARYICYIENSSHQLRLPGASALPDGLPAGEYTFNCVYNNESYNWS